MVIQKNSLAVSTHKILRALTFIITDVNLFQDLYDLIFLDLYEPVIMPLTILTDKAIVQKY